MRLCVCSIQEAKPSRGCSPSSRSSFITFSSLKVGMWDVLSRIPDVVVGRTSSTGSLAATLVFGLGWRQWLTPEDGGLFS